MKKQFSILNLYFYEIVRFLVSNFHIISISFNNRIVIDIFFLIFKLHYYFLKKKANIMAQKLVG